METEERLTRGLSRRAFLMGSMAVGLTQGRARRKTSAAETVNVAVVGAGGRGADNVRDLRDCGVNIIALCDCDQNRAADTFQEYPRAKRHSDWRRLFEQEKEFDAVVVSTPDHNHAIISLAAMQLGKHVYCEKPLTRTVWEARQMAKRARESGVVTQMGTQGHAFEGTRRAVEAIRSGILGDVKELHVWTDRPAGWWAQGIERPRETPPVPAGLDWDVWLGPAPERPYHPAYVPFAWRGFWDFGTGAIGDMGIHNLDTAFWGLELTAPTVVEVKDCSPAPDSPAMKETAPLWSVIELQFPARGRRPPVKMTWYDGGKLPLRDLFQGEELISKDGGSLVIGEKGTLFTRTWHGGQGKDDRFLLLPRAQFEGFQPPRILPRTESHHREWVDAIRGQGKTHSPFGYAAVLTESLLLGNLALRTGRRIEWDSRAMRARGCPEADSLIRPHVRAGWTLG